MNEGPYRPPVAGMPATVHQTPASLAGESVVPTEELAQRILMGMQRDIEAQIDWRLQQRGARRERIDDKELGLILGSIGIGVPLTAIGGGIAGLPGIIVVWIGLVALNAFWAVRR